jgi:anti-sigma factor RsiW
VSRGHALACAECRDLLGGYVLDALEPGEAEAVGAHIASCPECAREHAMLAPVPSLLDVAGSADAVTARPPAALEEVVLDRFAHERPRLEPAAAGDGERDGVRGRSAGGTRRRDWLSRPLPVATAAAIVAALVTLALTSALGDSDTDGDHYYGASLRGSPAAPGAHAHARQRLRALVRRS